MQASALEIYQRGVQRFELEEREEDKAIINDSRCLEKKIQSVGKQSLIEQFSNSLIFFYISPRNFSNIFPRKNFAGYIPSLANDSKRALCKIGHVVWDFLSKKFVFAAFITTTIWTDRELIIYSFLERERKKTHLWKTIVKTSGVASVFFKDQNQLMIFQRPFQSDLFNFLNKDCQLGLSLLVPIIQQIFAALTLLHSYGIIHGDIKPENILVRPEKSPSERKDNFQLAITDFGNAVRAEDISKMSENDIRCLAPYVGTMFFNDPSYRRKVIQYLRREVSYEEIKKYGTIK